MTMDDRAVAQARGVVRTAHHVLRDAVSAVYLYGSGVLGGLRAQSDLDLFVVLTRPMTDAQRRDLVRGIMRLSGARADDGPARPVELTVVVSSEVRPWRYPPRMEFQYGEWLRDDYERGQTPSAGPSPDLALLVTMVRLSGRALIGPPPAALLDPIPRSDLVQAMVDGVPDLLVDLADDTRNVVLTLARIWTTLATGKIRSKDAAADWALRHLPAEHRAVLAHARAVYLGSEVEGWDELRTQIEPHVHHVLGRVKELAEGRAHPPDSRAARGPSDAA